MKTKTDYSIKTLNDFLSVDDNFRFDDIDPELMTLTIKIHGEQFESSITGEVAKAIGSLQAALYRAAAEILHGEPNIKLLSAEEKEHFEIIVQVKPGCSQLTIPGKKYLSPLLEKMVDKMESKHCAIVACSLISAFAAVRIVAEVSDVWENNDSTKALVEQARILSAPINTAIQSGGIDLAKAAKNADNLEFGDRKFDRYQIEDLNKRSIKQVAQVETYQSECIVEGVHQDGTKLKIDLLDKNLNESFTVMVPPSGAFRPGHAN